MVSQAPPNGGRLSPIIDSGISLLVELRFNARLLVTDVTVWIPMKTPVMLANRENNVSIDVARARKPRLIIGWKQWLRESRYFDLSCIV